jgi:hypothetical protein
MVSVIAKGCLDCAQEHGRPQGNRITETFAHPSFIGDGKRQDYRQITRLVTQTQQAFANAATRLV